MPDDPFPRERVAAMARHLPAYLKLAWRLARDPLLSRVRRAAVVAAAGYLASPIDLVPGVIPVAGQLDDLAVAIAALKLALAGLDPERRQAHLAAVGLEDGDLATDLRTIGVASAWIVRAGARTTGRVARRGGSAAVTGAKVAGRAAARAAPVARDAAARAGETVGRAAPVARDAAATAARTVPAVRAAAARGLDAVKGLGGRHATVRVRVSRPSLPALGAGGADAAEASDPPAEGDGT